jgi:UDP-N-acetylglucosamine 2-epimerase (non-hydrolysing)
MIDTLHHSLERAGSSDILDRLGLEKGKFCAVTLHRPSNVDDQRVLSGIIDALLSIGSRYRVVFPVHPRTRARLNEFGLAANIDPNRLLLLEPMSYFDFLQLYSSSRLVLTDSGGIQEETTALGIPCLTLRENTERPITVTEGTNRVVGNDREVIEREAAAVLDAGRPKARVPELWDGRTASRIVDAIEEASNR